MASVDDQGMTSAGTDAGSSASLATLRVTSSSRIARDSAADRTWRMTWTLRTDLPSLSLGFRNACTFVTDRRLSG